MSYDYLQMYHLNKKMGFEVGSRVRVVKHSAYKAFDLIGECGTVDNISGSIRVVLDDIRNPNSSYGAFYFKPGELEITDKLMEVKTMQNSVINYVNIAKIKFINNSINTNTYEYANFDPELKVGDICVVKSAHHGFGIAKVEEIIEQNDVVTQREIVAKVDIEAYKERLANREKAAALKAKMQERAKQLQDIALYKMMADNDPVMLEMLKEYQDIVNM